MKKLSRKELEDEYYNYLYLQECYENLIDDIFKYLYCSKFRNSDEYLESLNRRLICYYRGKYEERKK